MRTGQKISVNRAFTAGESMEITTEYGKRGAVLTDAAGAKSNGFKFLGRDPSGDTGITMTLEPGENVFRFDADEGRELSRVYALAPRMGVLSGV